MESWKDAISERLQGNFMYIVAALLICLVIVYIYLRGGSKKKVTAGADDKPEESSDKDEVDELIESINEKQSTTSDD